jgi:membrane protein
MGQSWGKGLGARLERHFSRDIWAKDAGDVGGLKGKAYALSRLGHMVVKGFLADHCIIRASSLTFTTILSIVTLLSVAFSISKGFACRTPGFSATSSWASPLTAWRW